MRRRSMDATLCKSCGYSGRGLAPGADCPECGVRLAFAEYPIDERSRSERATTLWLLVACTIIGTAAFAMLMHSCGR